MSKPKPPTYRTTNGHDYSAALARRGRQPVFTDAAIQACLTLKELFGLPLRQASGMVANLLALAGWIGRRQTSAHFAAARGPLPSTSPIVAGPAHCTC